MKIKAVSDRKLVKELKRREFFGLLDKLERGQITEDQVRRRLDGDKDAIPLPTPKRGNEPLIFGRTYEEITRMQGSGPLR